MPFFLIVMEIKIDFSKNFNLEIIHKKLLNLAQTSLTIWAKTYVNQTRQDVVRNNLFTPRTGNLLQSIQILPADNSVEISVNLNYGYYLEFGTRTYIIKPKDRKALKIPNPSGTGYIFRKKVKHPGIEPRGWFLGRFNERAEIVNNAMRAYFARGLKMIEKGEI